MAEALLAHLKFDGADQVFTFRQITSSLELSGPVEQNHQINLVYKVFNMNDQEVGSRTVVVNLLIRNPCIDPSKISVLTPLRMPDMFQYTLFQDSIEIASVSLLQVSPQVCMQGLEHVITFNGLPVTDSSTPLQAVQSSVVSIRTEFYTEDRQYLDSVQKLQVRAQLRFGTRTVRLDESPASASLTAASFDETEIIVADPCTHPLKFKAKQAYRQI